MRLQNESPKNPNGPALNRVVRRKSDKKQHEESRRKTDVLRKKEEENWRKKEAAQQKKDDLAIQRDANKALARISPLKSRLDGLMVDPLFNKASSFVQKDAIYFSARLDECFADADNILQGKSEVRWLWRWIRLRRCAATQSRRSV